MVGEGRLQKTDQFRCLVNCNTHLICTRLSLSLDFTLMPSIQRALAVDPHAQKKKKSLSRVEIEAVFFTMFAAVDTLSYLCDSILTQWFILNINSLEMYSFLRCLRHFGKHPYLPSCQELLRTLLTIMNPQ